MSITTINPYDLPVPDITVEYLIYGDIEYKKKGAVGAAMSIAWHCGNSGVSFEDTLALLRDPTHAGGAWLRYQETEHPRKGNRPSEVIHGSWNGGRANREGAKS